MKKYQLVIVMIVVALTVMFALPLAKPKAYTNCIIEFVEAGNIRYKKYLVFENTTNDKQFIIITDANGTVVCPIN